MSMLFCHKETRTKLWIKPAIITLINMKRWDRKRCLSYYRFHYSDVIMSTMASQIASLMIVDSTVYSGADQRKHQSSASVAFVRGIHRWPVNSPHKWPVTRKMFPLDDIIMLFSLVPAYIYHTTTIINHLTYRGLNQMAAILQITFFIHFLERLLFYVISKFTDMCPSCFN